MATIQRQDASIANAAHRQRGRRDIVSGWRVTENGIYVPEELAGSWERVARNRYVAHVDMLGMSQVTLKDPKLAWSILSEIVIARRCRVESASYTVNGRDVKITDHVAAFTFSDTILLFTKGDKSEDLRSILLTCLELFAALLSRSTPIRVGVAHGLFIFNQDENAFVGPPLVQAYRLGEEAQWLGAVLDQTVADRAAQLQPPLQDPNGGNLIVQWKVPLKTGKKALLPVLAWPRSHRNNFKVRPPISAETFYQAFVQLFGPFEGLRAQDREKYENTVAFVNAMLTT